jgi:hypothetical protein
VTALNIFASDQLDQSGEGVFLFCSVLANLQDKNALLVNLVGTDRTAVLSVGPRLGSVPRNSRWLVIGFVLPQLVKVQNQAKSMEQSSHLVLTHYMALVK